MFADTPTLWTADFLLLPSMVALAVILIVTNVFRGKTRAVRFVALLPILFLGFRYMGWRTFATLNFDDGLLSSALSVLMLVCELLIFFINSVSSWLLFTMKTNRTPEADELQQAVINRTFVPSVAVFIPTVNEPPSILRRTVTGCQMMDYPNKQIYLLDDGRRPEIEALAAEMGVGYFKRNSNEHFKAGNVNNALWQTKSDLIAFFDADFVPSKHFLTRTVGFFQKPKVALIQTPQNFYNPDLVETNLGLNSFTNEQDLFFRNLQPGRDAFNAVICCGTGFVLRRDRLQALGGMPTATITEDLMTSVYFQSQGYEVIYLNEALCFGEAPNRSVDHLKQRVRWARGIMQTLFTDVNPITCPSLNLWQRFYHFIGAAYWMMSLPRLIILLMPLAFLLFDLVVIKAHIDSVFTYFIPYYIATIALFSWHNGGRRSPFWSDVYELIPTFHLIPNMIVTFIDPFGLDFKVTPKGVTSDKVAINWEVVGPCLFIIALYTFGFAKLLVNLTWGVNSSAATLNLVWSLYAIALLWMTAMACIDVPQRRQGLRIIQAWPFTLSAAGVTLTGSTLDITEEGVTLKLTKEQWQSWQQQGQPALLNLPDLGIEAMPVKVNPRKQGFSHVEVGAVFGTLPQPVYNVFLGAVFNRLATEWEEQTLSEFKFFWLFVKTPLRMYPLAR
jgi:cellulose synthase (UDP-forming)